MTPPQSPDDGVARVERAAGVLAPAVALGAIFLATLLSPTFTWTGDPLSFLGSDGQPTRPLFNYGLVAGGLLSLPFGHYLSTTGRDRLQRSGGVLFALTGLAMGLVGVFPMGTDPHFPVAVAFYLLLSLTLWVHGAGALRVGEARRWVGAAAIALGTLNVVTWAVYVAVFAETGLSLAIPETVGALALGVWTAGTALRVGPTG
ncbi:DUF998 domain-containing protein [Halomarina litorea]|uniref:DUF998 domain-containing protein n=1 Tax=Halomarina litorea TaxID=2961595 RepID=UPI0020C2D9AA|nr:DUF998 domain-containing protein [Halomarina sp. BCD28]